MNRCIVVLMGVWSLISTCGRSPESIINRQFAIDLKMIDHHVVLFNDYYYPNGDGETEIIIRLEKELPDSIIQRIKVSNGADDLPFPCDIDSFIPSFLKDSNQGVYFFERINPEHTYIDHILFVYDRTTNSIYYHLVLT